MLKNEKIRDYGLALFFFSHVIAEILRADEIGRDVLETPKPYITEKKEKLSVAIKRLWELMSPDINWEFDEYTQENDNFFDYKNLFKNSKFVKSMTGRIIKEYNKDILKDPASSFSNVYKNL